MGIATPPPFPSILSHSKTNNYQQHHSFSIIDKSEDKEEEVNTSNSMSQDYHHQGIITFSNNGFERSAQLTHQVEHHHLAQQIRRDKVRVQGFDPQQQPPPAQPPTSLIEREEESGSIPGYETAGMLSEMFNFPAADAAAGELMEQQMRTTFRSPTTRRSAGSDWYTGNRQGMITGLGPLGDNSKNNHNQSSVNNRENSVIVHQHQHHNQIPSINTDSAAAMQLFLMNRSHSTTRSPSPSSNHTTPTPPPSSSSTLHMLLRNPNNPNTSLQGFHGGVGGSVAGGPTFNNQFTWASDSSALEVSNTTNHHHHPLEIGGVAEAQGLSLSLSSSLQHLEAAKAEELKMAESGFLLYNQGGGGGPSSSSSTAHYPYKNLAGHHHHQQHQSLHLQGVTLGQNHHQGPIGFGSSSSFGVVNVLRNSKYVKAAQELLEEFCSVGRGQFKKSRQLANPSSNQGGSGHSGGRGTSSSSSKELPPLSAADRIEHQRRKVKLLTMLDEVDRRYNHYCEQMHMVVNSFDVVMGYGAAVPYTVLAQKAMSRHFRCLKDAITEQLKHSCEVLGEKDGVGTTGLTKGETPRLRILEQSLRQQRAFHQMGMMEQEAWRPQRGLPERSVNILRVWLFEHFLHPYPSDADKHLLARQTGLSRNQFLCAIDDEYIPKAGMTFTTVEEAGAFSKEYAKRAGFSTKIRNTNRCKETKEIKNQLITCNRQGKWISEVPYVEKTNPTCGANCPARIYVHVVKKTKLWCISKVVLHHSHPCFPDQAQMLAQHRELSMHVRCTIENNDLSGIRPNQTYQSFVTAAGGHNELGFIERDVRNYITREVRNVSEEEDAHELGKYFFRMKEQNQEFFYEIEVDGDNRIKNAFWADARSRAAFEYFGDVVSFDTTYNKNRYDLPFASFVGVNHHGHSTLLGCALMKNEDTESFKWLFRCWLRCMGGKEPKGIITDQCPSMPSAIESCMPTTIHRWCIWHIMKKIPQKLNGFKDHVDIEGEMSQIVWSSLSQDIFERDWESFINKRGLHGNKWLSELYEDRHLWVPVYLDINFWAGMRSTQRSESMHAFFNKFITRKSSLIQLAKQYDNCLGDKEQKEREADAGDSHTSIPCAMNSIIEAQFQDVYTHAKFKEVQTQFRGNMNCVARFKQRIFGTVVYDVFEEVSSSKRCCFEVLYDSISLEVKCKCLLFESRGIVCRHALLVLSYERVDRISPTYILEHWSKNCIVKRRHTSIKSSYDAPVLQPRTQRYNGMLFRSYKSAEEASEFEVLTAMYHRGLDKLDAEMKKFKAKLKENPSIIHEDGSLSELNDLQSPTHVRSRGRPKKRLGSITDKKIASATNKKRRITLTEVQGSSSMQNYQSADFEETLTSV